MPIVAILFAIAVATWSAVYARRGSLLLGCGFLLFVSYALGHEFWRAEVGPLPLTFDRLLLIGLAIVVAIRWRLRQLALRPLTVSDWALAAVLAMLTVSAFFSGQPEVVDGVTSKWGRLIASFVIPSAVYLVVRCAPMTERETRWLLTGFVVFGVYLAVTAIFEILGQWSFVFPRYIGNPELGIHFGRARGPELNSVSLGMTLAACIAVAWVLLSLVEQRGLRLAVAASIPLMAIGVYFTYTRSTWLGLAASGLMVAAFSIPKRLRLPVGIMAGLVGVLVVTASWSSIVGLEREGTAAESEHSVDQRKSFAYVSWQMFHDHPLLGVGFGRFYDRKLPYLSDRSQSFELESIRHLHHHNTPLSILTETGLVGLFLGLTLTAVWVTNTWRLAKAKNLPSWSRLLGILMLALLANYMCSALFHDLTLLPSQQLLLFAFAAMTVNARQLCSDVKSAKATGRSSRKGSLARAASSPRSAAELDTGQISHVDLFGMRITRIAMLEAVAQILAWCREPRGAACRYVVTPNVDHAVLFQGHAALRSAYADASLVLADGAPIVVASRVLGRPLPERVAGSDLAPQLLQSAGSPLRMYLLGAGPGVAESAARRIERHANISVVGTYSPPVGFEHDADENSRILAAIAAARPDLLIVGLGAPKQELWVHQHRGELQAKVVLCAGATIDFLAGTRERSPVWMRRVGLEWLHRLGSEPRRLAARYARDAWVFPQMLWREWRRSQSPPTA